MQPYHTRIKATPCTTQKPPIHTPPPSPENPFSRSTGYTVCYDRTRRAEPDQFSSTLSFFPPEPPWISTLRFLSRLTPCNRFQMLTLSPAGGRTAWSSTVTISPPSSHSQQTVQARYWYDGQYVHNAKEDAAEVAFRTLTSGRSSSTSVSSSSGSGGYSAAMSGAMSPGGSYTSAGWSAGSSARPSQGQGSGAWPGSPRASRWGSIGGG